MSGARRTLVGVLLALVTYGGACVVPLAHARADGSATLTVEKVEVRAWSPWPEGLNKGWQPLFVELVNRDGAPVDVRLECRSGWNPPRTTTRRLRLAGGERTTLEMLVHMAAADSSNVLLSVDAAGKGRQAANLGAGTSPNPKRHALMVFADRPPDPGTTERWQFVISTEVLGTTHVRKLSGSSSSSRDDNMRVAAATYAFLPQRPEAYSSLDLVVLDTRGAPPPAAAVGPLLAWVRSGGCLAVFGPAAEERARQLPGVAGWLEERFRAEVPGVRRYVMGLGTLLVDHGPGVLDDEDQRDAVRWACERVDVSVVPDPAGSRLDDVHPAIPGLGRLPFRAFSLLLIVFAIVIGPVNFILVKRSGKPVLLLLTIPALALFCSLLLLAYGITAQGLDVKTASHTWTVLDQREHRAATVEKRMLYAGLARAQGLRPAAGTSCYDVRVAEDAGNVHALHVFGGSSGGRGGPVRVDETDGVLLSGRFLPARSEVVQLILSEHAARGRLEIRREGAELVVENGLEETLHDLVLRDAAGAYHSASGPVAPGATAKLQLDPQSGERVRRQLLQHAGDHWPLVPASWTARIGRNAFGDACGLELREVAGRHHVLGILDLEDPAWR